MYKVTVSSTDDMKVEVDARLSAMATFLRELDGDPAARTLFARLITQIGDLISDGLNTLDDAPRQLRPLRSALAELRHTIEALPAGTAATPLQWQRIRSHHQACCDAFSTLTDALPDRGISQHIDDRHDLAATA